MDDHSLKARAIELIIKRRKVSALKVYAALIAIGLVAGAIAERFLGH